MIKINLLPFRTARTKVNVRRQIFVFLGLVFITLAAMTFFNNYLNEKIKDLNQEISNITIEVNKYKKQAAEVDELKKKLAVLKNKIDVINSLESNRKKPVYMIDSMTSMIVDKRMWLTSFDMSGSSAKIEGIALDEKTVSDYMINLEKGRVNKNGSFATNPNQGNLLFSSVTLNTLNSTEYNGAIFKKFVITCSKNNY